MENSAQQIAGWCIADAIQRCVDPGLLSALSAAREAWRTAGRQRRFSSHSEIIYGYEAVLHNQSEEASRKILFQCARTYADVKSSLVKHLVAARIIGWGRSTLMTDPQVIPAAAWRHLLVSDVEKSVVRERAPGKTKIFDVRIFPIVESPDAIDRLANRTFADAFQLGVVDDPQLQALQKRAITNGGTPVSFGNEWHPYRVACVSQDTELEPTIGYAGKSDEPTKHDLVKAAYRVQCQRFEKLVSYLSAELLVAEGIPAAGGMAVAIPRSIWEQDGTYINLENGDLLVASSKAKARLICPLKPLFTGLVLRKAGPAHRISEITLSGIRPVAASKVKSKKIVVSKMASEKACLDWLLALMRSSPDDRPEIKDFYRRKAHRKWSKSLSKRGFDRAWAMSGAEVPAPAWIAGGAPKKPLQSKPPHQ
jgi:hypothetical protein